MVIYKHFESEGNNAMKFSPIDIILTIVLVAFFLYTVLLTLQNKFNNKILRINLNENSNDLLNSNRYTSKTLNKIKFLLIFRSLLFFMTLFLVCLRNYGSGFLISTAWVLFIYFSNIKIEKLLQNDFENWQGGDF